MPPSAILKQCLGDVFHHFHTATAGVVLKAIDAVSVGGWLTMTEIARHWPDATHVAAPLKAIDRLLRSDPLTTGRERLYGGLMRWLVRETRPLIVVDWSDLKADGGFKLLRAGLAVQGRTLTLWEEVHPSTEAGTPKVEEAFLGTLARLLPITSRPIVITDAGFRSPWFRAVTRLGWDYVGRVRGMVHVQSLDPRLDKAWAPCHQMHALAPKLGGVELGRHHLGRGARWVTRLVVCKGKPKGRHAKTLNGQRRSDHLNTKAARSAREPWLLATSLSAKEATTPRLIDMYACRMTIEESFRDLKSGHLGAGFEHSRTHKGHRLANLLVLFALAQFATWLLGWCEEERGEGGRLEPRKNAPRKHHSLWRLGMEVVKRRAWWPPTSYLRSFLRRVAKGCPGLLRTAIIE